MSLIERNLLLRGSRGQRKVRDSISTNFFFEDTARLFNDTIFILDELSEELIIGAKTMQAWQITLDFEHESVVYDKSLQRLRV